MSAFDIPPHSRGGTRLAMGVLALVAGAAFAEGFLRQLVSDTPPPPPRPNPALAAIAEAQPAAIPTLQAPQPVAKPRKHVDDEAADADTPPLLADIKPVSPAPAAADASAIAPDTNPAPTPAGSSPAAPPPGPDEAPT